MANPRKRKAVAREAADAWQPMKPAIFRHNGQPTATVDGEEFTVYMNNRYTVMVRAHNPDFFHLSIRRNDRAPIFDWRDMQRIKNEIVGPEHEAVQLFPAESRLVDTSNQYHLYALRSPGTPVPLRLRRPDGFRIQRQRLRPATFRRQAG